MKYLLIVISIVNSALAAPCLEEIWSRLASIKTFSCRFVQHTAGSPVAAGVFYIKKPHKVRLSYEQGRGMDLYMNEHWIISYDRELDQSTYFDPKEYPVLGILVSKDKESFKEVLWGRPLEIDGRIEVAITHNNMRVTLLFSKETLQFHGWRATDIEGNLTEIQLKEQKENEELEDALFIKRRR